MKVIRALRCLFRAIVRCVRRSPKPPLVLELGEIAYNVEKSQFLIGNGTPTPQAVAHLIIGPHDHNAYAKLDGHSKLIPIGFPKVPS